MAFSITVTPIQARLHVVASGDAGLAEFIGLANLAGAIARGHGHRKVLIDLLGVHPHLAFTEHLQLGTHLGQLANDFDRIATVVPRRSAPARARRPRRRPASACARSPTPARRSTG
jgi:hypothetical protein